MAKRPFACANRDISDSHATAEANRTVAQQACRDRAAPKPLRQASCLGRSVPMATRSPSMETFQVILEGGCLEGFDPAEVRTAVAELLGQTEAVAGQLLAGREVVVKSRVDIITSTRYVAALRSIGVASWVVPEVLDLDVDLAVRLMSADPEIAVVGRSRSRGRDTAQPRWPVLPSQHGRAASKATTVFGWFVVAGTAFVLIVGGVALLTSSSRAGKAVSTPTSAPAPAQQVPTGRPPL